jgi:hypothetical protein
MKMKLSILLVALLGIICQSFAYSGNPIVPCCNPSDVQIVITPEKIWFMTDEAPVKHLNVQLVSEAGKIVLEKVFSSKSTDWSMDVRTLPAGKFRIMLDSKLYKTFVRKHSGA